MIEIINLVSAVIAVIAIAYLFVTASKCSKGLKTSLILLGSGVFIALAVHSFIEALEAFGYLELESLLKIMPVLVFVGSILLIIGTYKLHQVISNVQE